MVTILIFDFEISHFLSSFLFVFRLNWILSERLLTRFDNECAINRALSI